MLFSCLLTGAGRTTTLTYTKAGTRSLYPTPVYHMVKLRSFDAFPKLNEAYTTQGAPSSPVKNALIIFAVLFLYLETTSWMNTTPNEHFEVDRGINDNFQINLEIAVRNSCENIGIFIQDLSEDRLFVNELVRMIPYSPLADQEHEWCQIAGIFDTNRVKGRLTIGSSNFMSKSFDTTHAISELSFGDFYPEVNNPLDMTTMESTEPTAIAYFISIVPARFRAFGMAVETYLYSARHRKKSVGGTFHPPQISFEYDFDPIKVDIADSRMSFFQWMLRVVNIGGGLIFTARAAARFMKRKISKRENVGLLDQPAKS